ncbi:hypothetical protein J416_08779 [Gracilibacillus halophilus YIM-C55.5]|uniref:DUF2515 domain-containing protein n=1 Tax=Gracilibacillus halophilus YIM-C55.5 TaxID=1308866 RepID=N4WUI1_9BACI|nr:DUF2515 family protein [Gracilibacillus halophilus]ENH96781.1 hypothetical protein J416_08779 [Gracilibacillus halophilus YIM-C55.5]
MNSNKFYVYVKELTYDLQHYRRTPVKTERLSTDEQELVQRIHHLTRKHNQTNITRTNAYLKFYRKHPDIRWAFLAHMVSRNTGWNMTDLKGSLHSRLLSQNEQASYFQFLERGNWLIFQDAYPQLLLYEESIKRRSNFFYLLPYFGVSLFMEVLWNHFYLEKIEPFITTGLIINEQCYIEKRVIQHRNYQQSLLETLDFRLQDLLHLNQMIFPLHKCQSISMVGQNVHHFASLHQRILLGKRLLALLFSQNYSRFIHDWAFAHPHTGSRHDFWPELFSTTVEVNQNQSFQRKLKRGKIIQQAPRLYSPTLSKAWDKVKAKPAEQGDWFTDTNIIHYLKPYKKKIKNNIQKQYCKSLNRLERAVVLKEKFMEDN